MCAGSFDRPTETIDPVRRTVDTTSVAAVLRRSSAPAAESRPVEVASTYEPIYLDENLDIKCDVVKDWLSVPHEIIVFRRVERTVLESKR